MYIILRMPYKHKRTGTERIFPSCTSLQLIYPVEQPRSPVFAPAHAAVASLFLPLPAPSAQSSVLSATPTSLIRTWHTTHSFSFQDCRIFRIQLTDTWQLAFLSVLPLVLVKCLLRCTAKSQHISVFLTEFSAVAGGLICLEHIL